MNTMMRSAFCWSHVALLLAATAMGCAAGGDADTTPIAPTGGDAATDPVPDVAAEAKPDASPGDASPEAATDGADAAQETQEDAADAKEAAPDAPADVACPSGYKSCGGSCVAADSPDFGCTATGCDPCSLNHATSVCDKNACTIQICDNNFSDCNTNPADGCEVDLLTNAQNCGNCGEYCVLANATAKCEQGVCAIDTCNTGFKNCDTFPETGCEANTQLDPSHCGACNLLCQPVGSSACANGTCQLTGCTTGKGDCNQDPDDGCEVNLLTTLTHCGFCGNACALVHATSACNNGVCEVASCDTGYSNCDGLHSTGCEVETGTSALNCGACSAPCSDANNGSRACAIGVCSYVCNAGYADCDGPQSGAIDDGCEVWIGGDIANCGACGKTCSNPHGSANCNNGVCVPVCALGWANCNADPADGCETASTTVNNCGACGVACTNVNGTTACTGGLCAPVCAMGYSDCDGNPNNGCETASGTDTTNCGGCGVVCSNAHGTTVCAAGVCVPSCLSGFGDCDSNPKNGCEADIATSIVNCGACAAPCSTANNTAPACANGLCSYVCTAGYSDCNGPQPGATDDGCETWIAGDAANCGGCGKPCTNPHGSTGCVSGVCAPTCAGGWKDCNANPSDGCETAVDTVSNCGSCGVACTNAHGVTSCVSGLCAPVCANGYSNCDVNLANGCEALTATDVDNCGGCNVKCTNANGTTSCAGGVCVPTCVGGFGDCDSDPKNGCEADIATSILNCGACSAPCSNINNGSRACANGLCSYVCATGYTDCNGPQAGSADDGCETWTAGDVLNCGVCGKACTNQHGGTTCLSGVCTPQCAAGWKDCNANPSDGCEASIWSTSNCGNCGTACTNGHGTTSCPAGVCVPACANGWSDCDNNPSNGCEASTTSDSYNCGGCNNVCQTNTGTVSNACVAGACVPTCASGYGDCDGKGSNGCEISLGNSYGNCGTCGHSCAAPYATTVCSTGTCAIVGCNTQYYDIDKNPATGCEYHCGYAVPTLETCDGTDEDCDGLIDETFDKQNDPNNCGTCGTICGSSTGGLCCAGTCKISDATNCGACGHTCTQGMLVINELMIDPVKAGDALGEWFELYNPSAFPIDIRGFKLTDLNPTPDSHTINSATPVIVPAGGLLVLGNNATKATNGGVDVAYQYGSFDLGNGGDEVIITAFGIEVDRVVYPTTFESAGKSMELGINQRTYLLNDNTANWCVATLPYGLGDLGTPNAINSCAK
jgi:hypothetical protein